MTCLVCWQLPAAHFKNCLNDSQQVSADPWRLQVWQGALEHKANSPYMRHDLFSGRLSSLAFCPYEVSILNAQLPCCYLMCIPWHPSMSCVTGLHGLCSFTACTAWCWSSLDATGFSSGSGSCVCIQDSILQQAPHPTSAAPRRACCSWSLDL